MMKVIDIKDFEARSFLFKGTFGNRFAEFLMRVLSVDEINRVYNNSFSYSGSEFTSRLLDDLGVNYIVGNADRLKSLPEGPFITISNHPYGGLDGIISIDLIGRIRPDYKFMVNKILTLVKPLGNNFISVTPVGNRKTGVTSESIKGIRETLKHLQDGHPVGFFPSGAVSDFSLKDFRIRDRKWQKSIIHLIHAVKVPVLPIRFFDKNSSFFYFLGLINWRIRLLKMPSEIFNKSDHKPRVGIGNIITVKEQEKFADPEMFGTYLRKAVYEMPLPTSFISGKIINL